MPIMQGPVVNMKEPPYFLEACYWPSENPEALLAAEVRLISFIDAERHIYILGYCEFLNPLVKSAANDVMKEWPTQSFTYDALAEWLWPEARVRKDIRWFELYSSMKAELDDLEGFTESMGIYVAGRESLKNDISSRSPLGPADRIILNCDATEVEQKLKAANRLWLPSTSD